MSTFNNTLAVKRTTKHPFHIVDVSPWPLLTSFSAFSLLLGLTLYVHQYLFGFRLFIVGLLTTIVVTALWWRDIVREGTYEGAHTTQVQYGLRFGMILFIVSEIMLFFAFFWAYFHSSLNPVAEIGGVWPPKGIEVINPWLIPLLNTAILLTSGASLTWSHAALLGGFRLEAITGLLCTLVLATLFTAFQAYEYLNAPFTISDGIYGTTFYMLTGLHGFHVIVGTLFLAVALYRQVIHHYTNENHIGYESAAWYWHFVDVVWIFLFLAVYSWGGQ
jgi:heme/copper-type cytochrome/quinol oxidase subunit 3